ncbi:MAG: CBS domain-containing protein, partial [Anaerolineae bacterium]|nr:CBS domain-containing protein [Anaerolineae bacterium]
HELIREEKVSSVMTATLYTLPPDASMKQLKDVLREQRISGVPVVRDSQLLGVVSIEDLIHALEEAKLDSPVQDYMTRGNLIIAQAEEPVMQALRRFEKTGIGRMPVVDTHGTLVGIITRGDITMALLHALQEVYTDAEHIRDRPQHFFEALESDKTSLKLTFRVKKGDFFTGGDASTKIKQALLRIGASAQLARRVAIATYEAEINLVIHTEDGGWILADIQPSEINVVAQDTGPGIEDVARARQPGYSTATPEIREMGFGAGMGLTNIQRCVDQMSMWSAVGVGTRLQMTFKVSPEETGEVDQAG